MLSADVEEGETQDIEEPETVEQADADDAPQQEKKKRTYTRREPGGLVREPGKSLLPFSRVQKIIKADKEIPIIAKDATFLISLATEEFIKRLVEASKMVAEREKRATVQHKDIATVVRRADEFLFLEEIIPWMSADLPAKRKPRGADASAVKGQPTMDTFVVSDSRAEEDTWEPGDTDIVMNEDGTMGTTGGSQENYFE